SRSWFYASDRCAGRRELTRSARCRCAEVLFVEREDFRPRVRRLDRSIAGAINREEAVAGAVVAVEIVVLAKLLQDLFGAVDVGGRWPFVVVAEDAEERAVEILRQIDRGDGLARA